MEILTLYMISVFLFTQTGGQDFNCSTLIPNGLSGTPPQASSQSPYLIEVSPLEDYILGSQIRVTAKVIPAMSSSFMSVYMAAQDQASNDSIGSWTYPFNDVAYSTFECSGGETVIAFQSNVSTTEVPFTWSLPISAEIPTRGFFFKATVVEADTTYWSDITSTTFQVEDASDPPRGFACPEDEPIFFPTSGGGVFVIIREPFCGRENLHCNGTLSGAYSVGNHTIQCNCTDETESTNTCDISFEVAPPDITCPEPSDVKLLTLPNGNITGSWTSTCIDMEGRTAPVACNLTEDDYLSPGDKYSIACNCTDRFNLSDSCVFTLDVPRSCPSPNSTNSALNCSVVRSFPQTNCSLECLNGKVNAIPAYGPFSCRSNMWEPHVFDTLCQDGVDFTWRSIFIYVPTTTSARNCTELRDLDTDIITFFANIFQNVLNEFCRTFDLSQGCNQSTSLEVNSNCSQIVTINITSTMETRFISQIAENYKDTLQSRNNISTIPLRNANYSASLTDQNKQEIRISELTFNCSSGYANVDNEYCVLCPPGTYLTALNGVCTLCDVGTYQDEAGQISCKECSSNISPGSVQCIIPTMVPTMVPTMEIPNDGLTLLFLSSIVLAGVLSIFFLCFFCVTCYFCQCKGDKTVDQPIQFSDREESEPRAYDNNIPKEEFEVDVVLKDYAGRTESDDEEDTILGNQHQYDTPPATPTVLDPNYESQNVTEL